MTREFDPLNEVDLGQVGFGEAKFVNVGWGKKETQFHGSLGKAEAVRAPEEVGTVGRHDDAKVRVVWREDGQFFAVSYVENQGNCRRIR